MEKSKKLIYMEGGFLFCGGWNFSKSVSVDPTFIREMRVAEFPCFYQFLHDVFIKLFCLDLQNNFTFSFTFRER